MGTLIKLKYSCGNHFANSKAHSGNHTRIPGNVYVIQTQRSYGYGSWIKMFGQHVDYEWGFHYENANPWMRLSPYYKVVTFERDNNH